MRVRKFSGGAWSTDAVLGHTPAAFTSGCILTDVDGGISAYWLETNTNLQSVGFQAGGDLSYAHKPPGGSWSAPVVVKKATSYPIDGLCAVLNGSSEIQIICSESDGGAILSNAKVPGVYRVWAYGQKGFLGKTRPHYTSGYTQGIIAKMVVKPSAARASLMDSVIAAEVFSGAWQNYAAYYVFAAHSQQAALLNWKPPKVTSVTAMFVNGNLTPVGGMTFTVDQGFQGDGTTGYLDTGMSPGSIPSSLYTANSACAWVYGLSATSNNTNVLGSGASGAVNELIIGYGSGTVVARMNNTATNGSDSQTQVDQRGLLLGNRVASGTVRLYFNGVNLGSSGNVAQGLPSGNIWIGAIPAGNFSTQPMGAAGFGLGMDTVRSPAQFAALHPYMQTVAGAP